jgi:uncharacterized protein (DUF1684 family)
MNGRTRRVGAGSALLLALAAGACSAEPDDGATADRSWREQLLAERAGNEAELRTSPTSPLTAVERHALRGPGPAYVHVDQAGVRIARQKGGEALALRAAAPGRWMWERGRGDVAAAMLGADRALDPGPIDKPSVFRLGRFSVMAQPSPDALVLMVHDAQREELRRFRGLSYFPPERRFAVSAQLERSAKAEQIVIPTTLNLTKTYHRHGTLRFTIDGQSCALTAYRPVGSRSRKLFVPFRDATSGKTTYGGGRYLDLEEPKAGTVVVDFNRAYNPMCTYSSAYNCPIPPAENRLRVAIEAGEKSDPH